MKAFVNDALKLGGLIWLDDQREMVTATRVNAVKVNEIYLLVINSGWN